MFTTLHLPRLPVTGPHKFSGRSLVQGLIRGLHRLWEVECRRAERSGRHVPYY